jgi:hypothetical protein
MTTTPTFPTAESALVYRKAHDVRVKKLYRMTMPTLRDIEQAHLARQGYQRVFGGPVSKDELISAILAVEYPADRMNETTHVLYHKPGETWSACEWCHPHNGAMCECPLRAPSSVS